MSERVQSEAERKLREEYPEMFDHPEAAENEVHLTSTVIDAVSPQLLIYRRAGMPSARLGQKFLSKLDGIEGDLYFFPIFVDVDEFLAIEDEDSGAETTK